MDLFQLRYKEKIKIVTEWDYNYTVCTKSSSSITLYTLYLRPITLDTDNVNVK